MAFTEEQRLARDRVERKEAADAVKDRSLALMAGHNEELFEALSFLSEQKRGDRKKPWEVTLGAFELVVYNRDPMLNLTDEMALQNARTKSFPEGAKLCLDRVAAPKQFRIVPPRSDRQVTIERRKSRGHGFMFYVTNSHCLAQPSGRVIGQRTRGTSPFAAFTPRER